MVQDSGLVVVRAYSQTLDAEMACSALRAAGIDATLADDHIVNANWLWSNAVGGVKVLVSPEDAAAAVAVLAEPAEVDTDAFTGSDGILAQASAVCPRCGSHDVASVTVGKRLTVLSWLVVGVPVVPVRRRLTCEACGHRFRSRKVEMNITIRPGTAADAGALAELATQTFHDTFGADDNRPEDLPLHLSQAYGPIQQGRELVDPDIFTLLADTGQDLVAYAQLRRGHAPDCVAGEAPLELWRFYVVREWHGRGLAHTLMQHVDAEAERLGARPLWLGVWERNERALAFYRKFGFVDVGSHIFMVETDAQTDRIMARPVASGPRQDA